MRRLKTLECELKMFFTLHCFSFTDFPHVQLKSLGEASAGVPPTPAHVWSWPLEVKNIKCHEHSLNMNVRYQTPDTRTHAPSHHPPVRHWCQRACQACKFNQWEPDSATAQLQTFVFKLAVAHDATPDNASLHMIGTMNSNCLWVLLFRANTLHAVLRDQMAPTMQCETSPLPLPPPKGGRGLLLEKELLFNY